MKVCGPFCSMKCYECAHVIDDPTAEDEKLVIVGCKINPDAPVATEPEWGCEDFECGWCNFEEDLLKPELPVYENVTKDEILGTDRTRASRRKKDWAKARRKRDITQHWWSVQHFGDFYDSIHQYSKNKIHCSCPMCRSKTRDKKMYDGPENWSISDRKRIEEMKEQEEETN